MLHFLLKTTSEACAIMCKQRMWEDLPRLPPVGAILPTDGGSDLSLPPSLASSRAGRYIQPVLNLLQPAFAPAAEFEAERSTVVPAEAGAGCPQWTTASISVMTL